MSDKHRMITHVAIMRGGKVYSLPSPNRHHHVLYSGMMDEKDDDEERDVQGFVDDTGQFLNRAEAYVIATASGQINRRKEPGDYDGTDLYSEDLW